VIFKWHPVKFLLLNLNFLCLSLNQKQRFCPDIYNPLPKKVLKPKSVPLPAYEFLLIHLVASSKSVMESIKFLFYTKLHRFVGVFNI